MTLINRWTEEINKMKHEIHAWGMGINSQEAGDSFIKRNKTKVFTALLFGGMGLLFYWIGLIGLGRICFLVLGLQVASWIFGCFKNLFGGK